MFCQSAEPVEPVDPLFTSLQKLQSQAFVVIISSSRYLSHLLLLDETQMVWEREKEFIKVISGQKKLEYPHGFSGNKGKLANSSRWPSLESWIVCLRWWEISLVVRWSHSVESNVGYGNAPSTGHSTASLTPSVASPGPTLLFDKEFSPLAWIWGDGWKRGSQPLLPGGHPAAKCISPHSQLFFRPIDDWLRKYEKRLI